MSVAQRGWLPGDLARGLGRFEAWRRRRRVGSRIPEPLWTLAARLSKVHGVARTSAVLGLDYYSLKRRAQAVAEDPPTPRAVSGLTSDRRPGAAFIELPSPMGKQCWLELDNGSGATMRMQLVGYDAAEVAAFSRSLWSAE